MMTKNPSRAGKEDKAKAVARADSPGAAIRAINVARSAMMSVDGRELAAKADKQVSSEPERNSHP